MLVSVLHFLASMILSPGLRPEQLARIRISEWDCEAANPLEAPKPPKNQSRWESRSKVGFLKIQKVGLKVGQKADKN